MQTNFKIVNGIVTAIMNDITISFNSLKSQFVNSDAFKQEALELAKTDEVLISRTEEYNDIVSFVKSIKIKNLSSSFVSINVGDFYTQVNCDSDINKKLSDLEERYNTILTDKLTEIYNLSYYAWSRDNKLTYIEDKVRAIVCTIDDESFENIKKAVLSQINILSIIMDKSIKTEE